MPGTYMRPCQVRVRSVYSLKPHILVQEGHTDSVSRDNNFTHKIRTCSFTFNH